MRRVARVPHPFREGEHAGRQALRMMEDQQLGHPAAYVELRACGSDVSGDTPTERSTP